MTRYPQPPSCFHDFLSYDAASGNFTWSASAKHRMAGLPAGSRHSDGYVRLTFQGRQYQAHILAWWVGNGTWPPSDKVVDHINRNPSDNRLANLRLASFGQNRANSVGGRTYPKGVVKTHTGKFAARTTINGRLVQRGGFATVAEAASAFAKLSAEIHGEFACAASK